MHALTANKIGTPGRCPANVYRGVQLGTVYLTTMSRRRPHRGWGKNQNAFYFNMLGLLQRDGTKNASIFIGGLLPICIMLTGCLVTERVELEDKNFPPSFVDIPSSPTPIGALIVVNRADFTKTEPIEINFELQVRDENIDQELIARYQISTRNQPNASDPESTPPQERPPIGGSGLLLRKLALPIQFSPSPLGQCYRLDLLVTSEFANKPDTWEDPALDGDLARAKWLIAFKAEAGKEEADIFESCPRKEYKPVKYTGSDGSAP
jgi:hypothetical protein